MSNYVTSNLVSVTPQPNTLAIRIDDKVFVMQAGGVDVSSTTATAAAVLSGYDFYDSSGNKTSGTIPTVSATLSANVTTVPAGYIATSQTLTVPEASSATVSGNVVTIPVGYIASQRTVTVGTAVAAQTITPGTSDQTISADSYLTGSATIKGDANLVAANIKSGVTIFGVTGSAASSTDYYKCASVSGPYTETYYAVSGAGMAAVNGNYTDTGTTSGGKPVYSFANSGTTYYLFYDSGWESWFIHTSTSFTDYAMEECLYYKMDWDESWYTGGGGSGDPPSVTLTTVTHDLPKTWTGYKAVFNSSRGIYTYEQSVTSGRVWGSGFTPVIGKTYDAGALVEAKLWDGIPADGLVFYAPLSEDKAETETSQTITKVGSGISWQTYRNVPCARFTNGSYLRIDGGLQELSSGSAPFTISAMCCLMTKANSYGSFAFGYGNASNAGEAGFWFSGTEEGATNNITIDFHNNQGFVTGSTYALDTWYHCCLVWDGSLLRPYINGTAGTTASKTVNMDRSIVTIGIRGDNTPAYPWDGYVAACRIYNRALSDAEVAALAAEFTPSAQ